jgi:S-(hydroxymethyl)glutathione dehydrogenase/alcohol dehydrogenase
MQEVMQHQTRTAQRLVRAAVCRAFGAPMTIETLHLRAPEAGEVEVDVAACAICHSDISYADGAWGGDLPAVYGHEAAGRITAVGPNVTGLSVGDFVVVTLIRACGTCASCGSGAPVRCESPGVSATLQTAEGEAVLPAMHCGAFAEAVVVHQSQVVKLPGAGAEIAPESAALLACGVITGVGAVVNAADLRAGRDVVVIGAGGVGLNAIQGARIAGARRIVAVDMTEEKLDIARAFGATDGVLATGAKPWKAAIATLGRGADAVFVTVGAAGAYDTAPRFLAPGGKVFMVGMPHSGALSHYEAGILAALGQGMVGSKMGDVVIRRDIPWMVDLYMQGRLKLDELVSRRWPLEEINAAIADTKTGSAKRNVTVF